MQLRRVGRHVFRVFVSFLLVSLQMQELEQRVTEADQRAENAEKQVLGQFCLLLIKSCKIIKGCF